MQAFIAFWLILLLGKRVLSLKESIFRRCFISILPSHGENFVSKTSNFNDHWLNLRYFSSVAKFQLCGCKYALQMTLLRCMRSYESKNKIRWFIFVNQMYETRELYFECRKLFFIYDSRIAKTSCTKHERTYFNAHLCILGMGSLEF